MAERPFESLGAFESSSIHRRARIEELPPEVQVEMDLLPDLSGYVLYRVKGKPRFFLVSPACQRYHSNHQKRLCGCYRYDPDPTFPFEGLMPRCQYWEIM